MTTDTDEITRDTIEGRIERSVELREAILLARRMRSQEKVRLGQINAKRLPVIIGLAPVVTRPRGLRRWIKMLAIIAVVSSLAFMLTVWALVTAQAWGII